MALGGPKEEGLLGEVASFGLPARQAERKPVKRLIKAIHQLFEIGLGHWVYEF